MPYVRSVSLGVWIGSGSRIEHGAENGISHFIEHMVFKGTNTGRPKTSRGLSIRSAADWMRSPAKNW